MAAFGLDSMGSQYKFDGTDLSSWWYREYALSYGRKLPFKPRFVKDLYAGISIKFVRGYGVFQTDKQNSNFGNIPVGADQYVLRGNFDFLTRRSGVISLMIVHMLHSHCSRTLQEKESDSILDFQVKYAMAYGSL
jgi:hypothetical protein